MLFKSLSLLATTLVSTALAADLPAIEVVGNKFFYSNNGSQFYMKGIAYQQDTTNVTSNETFVDPLADFAACKRDVPYLTAVATNVIRVYALNETEDHTDCMNLLAENGIYVIADLSEPKLSINRDSPSWTVELYNRYTNIVDEFQNYTNVLGFFAGNEVTNDKTNTDASAFVKAAVRDTKKYIKQKGYRSIPVGYSANDDSETRIAIADYFACGDLDERADFYGINMYSWCGDSNFQESGYKDRTKEFSNMTIPVFFSEYGCNEVQPRKFTEVAALYSSNMTDVWSGGIVYMYFQEANNYGLVSISGSSVSTMVDYNYYKTEILAVSPTSAKSADVSQASATLACPTQNQYWKASTDLPPFPDDELCSCMDSALSCVVSDSADSDDYEDIFGYICGSGQVSCDGIQTNGTTGKYGAFSFCSSKQKLSFVLDLYYKSQGKKSSACDFKGKASVVSNPSTASVCSAALSGAGSDGLGTVTATVSGLSSSATSATATGTGSASGNSGSGGKSATASNTSSKASSTSGSSGAGAVAPRCDYLFASVASLFAAVGGLALL